MVTRKPDAVVDMITETSDRVLQAWLEPWSMMNRWSAFWGQQWSDWLKSVAERPNVWLPALSGERHDQPANIDLFLPWLPRPAGDEIEPAAPAGERDAVRLMLKAAAPHVGRGDANRVAPAPGGGGGGHDAADLVGAKPASGGKRRRRSAPKASVPDDSNPGDRQ